MRKSWKTGHALNFRERLCEVHLELLLASHWPEFCYVASLSCIPDGQVAWVNVKDFIIREDEENQY